MIYYRSNSTFSYKQIRKVDINTPERTLLHSQIIHEKPFLRKLYREWYVAIKESLPEKPSGGLIELGSGGGFSKQIIGNALTSEILPVPSIDLRLDGGDLPFKKNSLKGIFMVDVFHHLPKVNRFLMDAARCVKPGGVVVMIEPWNTPWSRFIYKYLHHEPFDSKVTNWSFPRGGPLSEANSALPWIVFDRDRKKFERKYPHWKIASIKQHTPLRYLLSGGVSIVSIMPGRSFEFWRILEKQLVPLMEYIALFATIVLVRRDFIT